MTSSSKERRLPVTNSQPRPGDFALGSPESRAAARMLADHNESRIERLTILLPGAWAERHSVPPSGPGPSATPWIRSPLNGKHVRTLVLPDGMTAEEATRIVDGSNF